MPVKKDTEENGTAKFTINNGDLIALNRIKEQYNLKDSDDVITFAIGVLSKANGGAVSVTSEDGSITKFVPADQLKKQDE
jgi:hypothetical protein